MESASSRTLTFGLGTSLSATDSGDGGHHVRDAFLQTGSMDSESSASGCASSLSGKLSGSNTSSYCRIGVSEENSMQAMFFTCTGEKANAETAGLSGARKSLECPSCHREFANSFNFKVHLRGHTGKPYQCMICGRAFAQNNNAKRHIERHKVFPHLTVQPSKNGSNKNAAILFEQMDAQSSQAPDIRRLDYCKEIKSNQPVRIVYRCPYCSDLFNCHRCVTRHASTHTDQKVFQCPVRSCRQLYPKLEEFLAHLNTHGDRMAYDCPICGKTFDSLSDIGLHQCAHVMMNEKRPFGKKSCRCVECGDVFKSLESLERHYAQTTHEYRCVRCRRVYCNARRLRRHLKSHAVESKLACPKCKRTYSHARTLKWHTKHVHEQAKPELRCNQCSKTFKRRDVLRRHEISVHSAVSMFQCTFEACNKTFKRQDRLKEHVLTHGDVKKHGCETCGKSFIRLQAYKMHMRSVHEKSFKFHCESCQKGFNRPDKYEIHKKRCDQ